MPYTYILHSKQLDRFYIGHTELTPQDRLKKHLTSHSGFTAKAKDWLIVWTKEFQTKSEAYAWERKIKNWKSKIAICQLIAGA